jgi:hypothetical protein
MQALSRIGAFLDTGQEQDRWCFLIMARSVGFGYLAAAVPAIGAGMGFRIT